MKLGPTGHGLDDGCEDEGRPGGLADRSRAAISAKIDPATISTVAGIFERYALGTVNAAQFEAGTGLIVSRLRCMLMNRIYNGWVTRKGADTGPRGLAS